MANLIVSNRPFFPYNAEHDPLFDVRAGVPVEMVLEYASCFLESAISCTYTAAGSTENDSDAILSIAYLLEMAKGLVEAANASVRKGQS